ncbi:molybdopterin-guanine dinucleotide biosynthesis protein [Arthrobacter sp. Soil782]|uniref:DUF6457 domain-containing protein n=1 Tax=Arthrobacter sp. Soil782 TaxID=1736410 RepID=UPI0006FDACC9|nr:DUF6457 domain-containing protein [Arthrobacter sp. Soil782]KRF03948.1 molybdopterin-guanine dinucleotide biosynthesis protein [Arthrobacter sp. Soil782]
MEDRERLLRQWSEKLLETFELEDIEVDVDAVLALAGQAAHSVVRPAAPLTTFIAGYAAGMAVGTGQADSGTAMRSALLAAHAACPPVAGSEDRR